MFLRRLVTLLAASALAVGLSTALSGTARAEVPPSPDWNEIVAQFDHNFNNTLCVDDAGNTSFGARIWLWHCNSNPNQRWHFELAGTTPDGFGIYSIALDSSWISPAQDPDCISLRGIAPQEPGQQLALGACGFLDDMWVVQTVPGTNPLISIVNYTSGLCMAVADFSDNNGTPLIEKTCDPNDLAQVFVLG